MAFKEQRKGDSNTRTKRERQRLKQTGWREKRERDQHIHTHSHTHTHSLSLSVHSCMQPTSGDEVGERSDGSLCVVQIFAGPPGDNAARRIPPANNAFQLQSAMAGWSQQRQHTTATAAAVDCVNTLATVRNKKSGVRANALGACHRPRERRSGAAAAQQRRAVPTCGMQKHMQNG